MPGIINIGYNAGLGIDGPVSGRLYPAVIDDGSTRFFYISSVISATKGITKDGSNLASEWADYLESGRDLLQATGSNQPLWSANGVLFDGIDNFMKCAAFTWNQPEFIYMVVRQVTWTNVEYIFDGNITDSLDLLQYGSTPQIQAYAGTFSGANSNLAVNTWGIVRLLFNDAGSKLQVNETAAITGNFGAGNAAGFTLATFGAGVGGNHSHIQVKEIIGRSSTVGEAEIYAYLAAKYSI